MRYFKSYCRYFHCFILHVFNFLFSYLLIRADKFWQFLLQLWGQKLNSRPESEKTSMKGKLASATYTQTQDYIRPLFRRLKKENVPDDILEHLVLIVNYLLDRNYVKVSLTFVSLVSCKFATLLFKNVTLQISYSCFIRFCFFYVSYMFLKKKYNGEHCATN